MYERWSGKVDFLVVYIKEAYPKDGRVVSMNRDENIVIEDPVTKEDRVMRLSLVQIISRLRFPCSWMKWIIE